MPTLRLLHARRSASILILAVLVGACTSGGGGTPTGGGGEDGGTAGGGGGGGNPPPGATPIMLGPDLAALTGTPNTFACGDGYPVQINPSFPQPFYGQGAGSCLVLTFLAPTGQTLRSGTATAASIRVGPNTGPMRFVRMRILYNRRTDRQCCSLEQYGEPFTPTANSDTTVPLDFPITLDPIPAPNDLESIAANDLVALEVLGPRIPIPGIWVQNGGPAPATASYMWLPALSAQQTPAPSNQLLQYQGSYSGFVPTFTVSYVQN